LINYVLNDIVQNIFILGKSGVGKTRLAKEMAMFVIMRNIFPNGVYYLDFMKSKNMKNVNKIFQKRGLLKLLIQNN